MKISRIRLADTEADFDEARTLGRSWVDWQLKVYPELREPILAYFDPVEYEQTLAALPVVHARPKGAVLLADLGGSAVGCLMYLELEPGIAEVKRLFVDEAGRGHDLGQPCRHPWIASATVKCVTLNPTQTQRKWINRCSHRAEKRHCRASMMRPRGLTRPTPGVSGTTVTARGEKYLFSEQIHAILLSSRRTLGE